MKNGKTVAILVAGLLALQLGLSASPVAQKASIRQEMTSTEQYVSGIGKLTAAEIASLEDWFYRRYTTPNWEQARPKQLEAWQVQRSAVPSHPALPPDAQAKEANVYYNSRSGVIHRMSCRYVSRCTNCSPTTLTTALERGGRWCSHCQ